MNTTNTLIASTAPVRKSTARILTPACEYTGVEAQLRAELKTPWPTPSAEGQPQPKAGRRSHANAQGGATGAVKRSRAFTLDLDALAALPELAETDEAEEGAL